MGGKAKHEFKTSMEVYPRNAYWSNWPYLPVWLSYTQHF